jgi:nucleotide-binding universal stress UspA family protein
MSTPFIHTNGRILAAIDDSTYSRSVAEFAAWAARRTGAPLEFVHVLDRHPETAPKVDLSGNLALGAQDLLLDELAQLDEQRSKLSMERGRRLLQEAKRVAEAAGATPVDTRLRHGELVDTLLDLEADVRLFVIGKRGEHANFAKGHLGSNLERVVRAAHRPVLVASRAFRPVERFLIAFDGSATTRRCVEVVCASPLLKGAICELLMVGDESAAQSAHLAWATEQLRVAGFEPVIGRAQGSADAAIVETALANQIDLIVMGAYGHSRIRQLIVGSTTTQVLRRCQIPILLLR